MQDAIRVLYVDDEPDLLDIGKQFLEESGDFSVTTSGSAPAALDLISREKFEVIISDYQMPEMDGVQFLVEVRSRYGQVPFIMLTGRGSEEVAIQAINNGVDFYLQKGGEPEAQFSELSDKIKSVASWKRADEARKRAAFLEAQVETSPDGMLVVNDQNERILINRRLIDMWEIPDAILDDPHAEVLLECVVRQTKNPELFIKKVRDLYEHPEEESQDIVEFTDGRVFDRYSAPVIDRTGHYHGRTWTFRDITGRKRAEEALKKEQEFNRLLLDTTPAYFVAIGADGRTITMNKALIDALEYSPEEIPGTDYLTTFVPEEDRQRLLGVFQEIIFDGKAMVNENRIISKSGKVYLVEWYGRNVKHDGEKPDFFVGVGINITERKQAEEALRESEGRYRELYENSRDGYATVDNTGRITNCNRQFLNMLGYTFEEISRLGYEDITPSQWREMESGILLDQVNVRGYSDLYEKEYVRKDGTTFPIEVQTYRVADRSGSFSGYCAFVRDITERKRAEDLVRVLARISDDAPASITIHDLLGNFLYANEETIRLHGYTREEYLAKNLHEIDVPESEQLIAKHVQQILDTGVAEFEVQHFRKDGSIFSLHVNGKIVDWGGRKVLLSIATDLTERRQAEDALRVSEQKFRAIFNQTFQFIGLMTLDGTLIDANQSALSSMGITRDDVIGKPFWETPWWTHSPELQEELKSAVTSAAQGTFMRFEATHPAIDGSIHAIDFSLKPVTDESGRVLYLIPEGRDLTDRKQVEEALRETERRLEDIINFLPDATFAIDDEGRVIAWNRAIEEMTGVRAKDMLGKGNYEYALPFYGERRPILIDLVMMQGQGALNNYSAVQKDGDALTAETDRARVGGKDVCLWGKSVLFKNSLGEVVGAIESIRDITDRKMVEIALEKSRNLYRAIFETTGAATIIVGSDSTIILANSGFAKLSGFSIDELEGKKSWTEFVTGEDLERMKRYHHDRCGGPSGPPGIYEFRFVDRYGETRHCLNNIGVIPGTTQRVASIVDITGLKQAETAMRESEGKYRTVFENTGTATVVLNENSTIELANFRFAQLSGFSKDEIEGKKKWTEFVVPEDLERMRAQHQTRRQDREKALTRYEFRFVTKTGDIRSIYLFVDVIPGTNKSIASLLDITERKRAEELYHTVFENTGTAMIIVEENSVISHVNGEMEKIWGYSREEIEGRVKWQTLVAEEDLGKMQKYHRARRTGPGTAPSDYEFRFVHKNGEVRDADLTVTIIPGTQKSVVSLRDITELKKLDRQVRERTDQVEQLLRQKDEFIAQAGHDLKTPLTPIIALLPHILKKEQDPELRELLAMVMSDAAAMKHLITDILTLAKLNTLYTTADAKEMVLAAEVEKGIAMHAWMAQKQGNVIENTVSPDTRIWIIPLHLESLLDNLIGNAIRYSPDGGIVTISSNVTDEFIAISITDTGIGLTPEETVRIFDLFYKADPSRHQRDSSGLGLSIVSRIAHLYGGSVKAESPGKGCGSTFTVTLPRRP
ncbi:MAG: PAS domain S-box protein [Methanomicrobiales archaeon]